MKPSDCCDGCRGKSNHCVYTGCREIPPCWVKMHYYRTEYNGFLYIEYDAAHGYANRASINHIGTDMEISNYIFLDYLKMSLGRRQIWREFGVSSGHT